MEKPRCIDSNARFFVLWIINIGSFRCLRKFQFVALLLYSLSNIVQRLALALMIKPLLLSFFLFLPVRAVNRVAISRPAPTTTRSSCFLLDGGPAGWVWLLLLLLLLLLVVMMVVFAVITVGIIVRMIGGMTASTACATFIGRSLFGFLVVVPIIVLVGIRFLLCSATCAWNWTSG